MGLVVGRFNKDVNNLIEIMADSRVNVVARRDGRHNI